MTHRLLGSVGRQVTRSLGRDGSFLWPTPVVLGRQLYMRCTEPFYPIPDKFPQFTSADEAVSVIKSGMSVYVMNCAGNPQLLLDAMTRRGKEAKLTDVEIIQTMITVPISYTQPEYKGIFRTNSVFLTAPSREAVNDGRGDFIPIFLSDVPLLFRRKILNIDVALIQVSPPDEHGFCTLGPSVDAARAAIQNAKCIIAQVNKYMPRTFGDGAVHISHMDAMVEGDVPLPEPKKADPSPIDQKIGKIIADELVDDGATLQMGIGSIPDNVLSHLSSRRDLGVHSELVSDGIIDLVHCGAITNVHKTVNSGRIVAGFAFGSRRLYDLIHDNPFILLCDISFVNNVAIIAQNPKVTAINSCLEVDLTGQVVSDSIGTKMYSGVGGQMDFLRGAARSMDGLGKAILAMPSTTAKGESKIVPFLKQGAGVVTTRAHVHYIVTEYGVAYLFGKSLRQRAYELIRIAHPDHRASLEKAAFERLKVMPSRR